MKFFQHAVVADDGKAGGDLALQAASFLSEHFSTALDVVHAIDLPDPRDVGGDPAVHLQMRERIVSNARTWLRARVDNALGKRAGIATTYVNFGRGSAVLTAHAKQHGDDLVVLGPHSKEHLLDFGGTQRAVFSALECDVWSQPERLVPITRVLAPCDLSSLSMRALAKATHIAKTLSVPLRVLNASAPPVFIEPGPMYGDSSMPTYVVDSMHEAAKERFDAAMGTVDFGGVETGFDFEIGGAVPVITAARRPGDLLVLGTRGHTGLGAALLGGTAYAVLKAGGGPTLAVRS